MPRSVLPALGLATLVVLAGCNGFVGSPPPADSTPPGHASPAGPSFQELENATLWIDGTVERIENGTVYVDDQQSSDAVVPVVARNRSASFYCRAKNDAGIDCEPIRLNEVQPGEEVCASVHATNGSLDAIKVFFNATCGGPQAPPPYVVGIGRIDL